MKQPKIKLSRLREIGWSRWDPIGLGDDGPADEYDSYLLKAAGMVRNGMPAQDAVDYLVWAESDYIGLGIGATTRSRAEAAIEAIRNAEDLWSDQ